MKFFYPDFLNRSFGRSHFRENWDKLLEWNSTGARIIRVFDNNRLISQDKVGTYRIKGFGGHAIRFEVNTIQRSTLVAFIEGSKVIDINNHSTRKEIAGYSPCVQYDVPNARTNCKSGYRKNSGILYRTAKEVTGGIRNRTTRTVYGEWQKTRPNPPADYHSGGTFPTIIRNGRVESKDIYFCTPEAECQGDPIYNTVDTNTGNYIKTVTTNVSYTPQEKQQEDDRRTRDKEEKDKKIKEKEERKRLNKIQEALLSTIGKQFIGDEKRENSQDTKYRIITPLVYKTINGKQVPEIRYESVRYLSPEAVSNYVFRGYEVQSVDPNVPISYGKPYGQSIVNRSSILKPINMDQKESYNTKSRITWDDYNNSIVKRPASPVTVGGVRTRINNRRVIR